jgi:DNA-binding NarL/FixJ family response regulator
VEPVRILLADMAPMLLSIIRSIVADQPDIEVVGELSEPTGLQAIVERTGATMVIVGHDRPDPPDAFGELLARTPPVPVLAITDEGRAAVLYDLRPQRIPIGELSAARLVAVARGAGSTP